MVNIYQHHASHMGVLLNHERISHYPTLSNGGPVAPVASDGWSTPKTVDLNGP